VRPRAPPTFTHRGAGAALCQLEHGAQEEALRWPVAQLVRHVLQQQRQQALGERGQRADSLRAHAWLWM
jgi:hypothetical protein